MNLAIGAATCPQLSTPPHHPPAMDTQTTSRWQTLPGVLTALAGVITAVGGLVAILHQAGMLSPRAAAPDPEVVAIAPDSGSAAVAPDSAAAPSLLRAVIRDPDGYTNLRAGPSSGSAVKGRILESEVFTVLAADGDWWVVRTDDGTTGFVHRSRIDLVR